MRTGLIVNNIKVPSGKVVVSGAKNSATRLLCASLLTNEQVVLENFPTELVDVEKKLDFLSSTNIQTSINIVQSSLMVDASNYILPSSSTDFEIPVRTTYLFASSQLLRFGEAKIPYPGGCKLGERKYDLHIMVWEQFGCAVEEEEDYISIKCKYKQLRPAKIEFPITTVGGTENALLCGAITAGQTEIRNAYITPEIGDLIQMLQNMGAKICLHGQSHITIEGNSNLKGVNYYVMPDRIEAITWLIYGILSKGDIQIDRVPFQAMEIPLIHIQKAGIDFYKNTQSILINKNCINPFGVQPFEIACGTHPGVISDMQPFYTLLALAANGRSRIYDYRYPKRTAYLNELNKFCNNAIKYREGEITIDGPVEFQPATASSTDLRGSMTIILAALLANGESTIIYPEMAMRGYNKLKSKLNDLGINM